MTAEPAAAKPGIIRSSQTRQGITRIEGLDDNAGIEDVEDMYYVVYSPGEVRVSASLAMEPDDIKKGARWWSLHYSYEVDAMTSLVCASAASRSALDMLRRTCLTS